MTSITEQYGLPDLPDPYVPPSDKFTDELPDEDQPRELILYRFKAHSIVLMPSVRRSDASAYASREDTHGDGWFVGFDYA